MTDSQPGPKKTLRDTSERAESAGSGSTRPRSSTTVDALAYNAAPARKLVVSAPVRMLTEPSWHQNSVGCGNADIDNLERIR
ncbi:hypothetical protein GCM10025785_17830 [Corynebacterium canis]